MEISDHLAYAMRYVDSPSRFILEYIGEDHMTAAQRRLCMAVSQCDRVAMKTGHGTGKTFCLARLALWWFFTRPGGKVITTSPIWRHLEKFLWPNIHAALDKIKARYAWTRGIVQNAMHIEMSPDWYITGIASTEPKNLEGGHAENLLYLVDEAKGFSAEHMASVKGALTREGNKLVMCSTPGGCGGPFYQAFTSSASGYRQFTVTAFDVPAWLLASSYAEEMARDFGADSAIYKQKVLAEFCDEDSNQLIPLSWVEAAYERWNDLNQTGLLASGAPKSVGVDIGGSGVRCDRTVLAFRHGNVISDYVVKVGQTTMGVAGLVKAVTGEDCHAVIDANPGSVGVGVYDRCREQSCNVRPFVGSQGTDLTDRTGMYGFANMRSCALWTLREMLDPANPAPLAMKPDNRLTADLTAPTYSITSSGKIKVESKESVVKKLNRSPDFGDAVMMSVMAVKRRRLGGFAISGASRSTSATPPRLNIPLPALERTEY